MELVFFIFWLGINSLIGYLIGQKKNAVSTSVTLSILFGPVGWLISALMKGDSRKCPFCAEDIKPEAIVCPHCQRDLPKVEPRVIAPLPTRQVPLPYAVDEDETAKSLRHIFIAVAAIILLVIAALVIANIVDRSSSRSENDRSRETQGVMETSVASTAPPQAFEFVRLTTDYTLVDAKGRGVKTLEPGKKLRVVERFEHDLTIDYLGDKFSVPAAITEPSE